MVLCFKLKLDFNVYFIITRCYCKSAVERYFTSVNNYVDIDILINNYGRMKWIHENYSPSIMKE